MEMFGFDEDFISDLEVQCQSSSGISGTLIGFCASAIWVQSAWCSSSKSTMNSLACTEERSHSGCTMMFG